MGSSKQTSQRREQRDQTRRQILFAADRFLRRHPYRELSLEVVMAETGLTRTAFYRHFDDVAALVLQLLEDVGSELYVSAERWIEGSATDFERATHDGLAAIVSFFTRNGPLVRAIADAASTDEQIEQGYAGFLNTFVEMTTVALDQMVERGQLVSCDTRALSRALNLMNERFLLNEFGCLQGGDPGAALSILEQIWLGATGFSLPGTGERASGAPAAA